MIESTFNAQLCKHAWQIHDVLISHMLELTVRSVCLLWKKRLDDEKEKNISAVVVVHFISDFIIVFILSLFSLSLSFTIRFYTTPPGRRQRDVSFSSVKDDVRDGESREYELKAREKKTSTAAVLCLIRLAVNEPQFSGLSRVCCVFMCI